MGSALIDAGGGLLALAVLFGVLALLVRVGETVGARIARRQAAAIEWRSNHGR